MTIQNKTKYATAMMRQIFVLCLKRVRQDWRADWSKRNGLQVHITYARRRGFISGHGLISRGEMWLHIPAHWGIEAKLWHGSRVGYRYGDLAQALAATFIHELGHNLGVRSHRERCTIERDYEIWIYNTFSVNRFPLIEVAVRKPGIPLQELRYSRALSNLAAAQTRLKRAKTIFNKWQRKVHYYQRALPQAALKPGKGEAE